NGWAVLSPDDEGHGDVFGLVQLYGYPSGVLHYFSAMQGGQADTKAHRPEVVSAAYRVLLGKPRPHQAYEISMRFAGGHIRGRGNIAQVHGPELRGKNLEQSRADID